MQAALEQGLLRQSVADPQGRESNPGRMDRALTPPSTHPRRFERAWRVSLLAIRSLHPHRATAKLRSPACCWRSWSGAGPDGRARPPPCHARGPAEVLPGSRNTRGQTRSEQRTGTRTHFTRRKGCDGIAWDDASPPDGDARVFPSQDMGKPAPRCSSARRRVQRCDKRDYQTTTTCPS